MTSSWEQSKQKSSYHFDSKKFDPAQDRVIVLGHVVPTWVQDIDDIVANSESATWATRGHKGRGVQEPPQELAKEEYDLKQFGYQVDHKVANLAWTLPQSLLKISQDIGLENCMNRIHVQRPGQVWNLHLDKLQKWLPNDPTRVMRIMIQLTDWQPGQFWEYGNYHHSGWCAGEVTTFDWANLPHCTANAGHHDRVTLQLTGIISDQTREYLAYIPQ